MPFDSVTAQEAGRASGEARRALAALKETDPEAYVRQTFAAKQAELAAELLDAALGAGTWTELPLDKRLSALYRALEYAVGRPTSRKDDDKPAEGGGLSIV